MNMIWYPKGGVQLGMFKKNIQKLKYIGKESTHTPGTLHATPLGVLNLLTKLTSQTPKSNSKRIEYIYPDHAKALWGAGLESSIFITMGYLWKYLDKKKDRDKRNDPTTDKKKNRNVYFCDAYSHYLSASIHRVTDRLNTREIYHGL